MAIAGAIQRAMTMAHTLSGYTTAWMVERILRRENDSRLNFYVLRFE